MSDDLDATLRAEAEKYADSPEEVERLVELARARLSWRLRRGHKVCDRCKEQKPVTSFGVDSRERDGLRRICRSCRSVKNLA